MNLHLVLFHLIMIQHLSSQTIVPHFPYHPFYKYYCQPLPCYITHEWNWLVCQCVPKNIPQSCSLFCALPHALDTQACTCVCPNQSDCNYNQTLNSRTCECEDLKLKCFRKRCLPPKNWDRATCKCTCKKVCPRPLKQNTLTCHCNF